MVSSANRFMFWKLFSKIKTSYCFFFLLFFSLNKRLTNYFPKQYLKTEKVLLDNYFQFGRKYKTIWVLYILFNFCFNFCVFFFHRMISKLNLTSSSTTQQGNKKEKKRKKKNQHKNQFIQRTIPYCSGKRPERWKTRGNAANNDCGPWRIIPFGNTNQRTQAKTLI